MVTQNKPKGYGLERLSPLADIPASRPYFLPRKHSVADLMPDICKYKVKQKLDNSEKDMPDVNVDDYYFTSAKKELIEDLYDFGWTPRLQTRKSKETSLYDEKSDSYKLKVFKKELDDLVSIRLSCNKTSGFTDLSPYSSAVTRLASKYNVDRDRVDQLVMSRIKTIDKENKKQYGHDSNKQVPHCGNPDCDGVCQDMECWGKDPMSPSQMILRKQPEMPPDRIIESTMQKIQNNGFFVYGSLIVLSMSPFAVFKLLVFMGVL